jgi:hypothetical protein
MPMDLKSIVAKRGCLREKVVAQNTEIATNIKKLEANKTTLLKQKIDLERIEFMQKTTYNRAKTNYEFAISGYQGLIADCKHNLDNNII